MQESLFETTNPTTETITPETTETETPSDSLTESLQELMNETTTIQKNSDYIVMGSFNHKNKKENDDVIEHDDYYFKLVSITSKGDFKIGIVQDKAKKRLLSTILNDPLQMTLETMADDAKKESEDLDKQAERYAHLVITSRLDIARKGDVKVKELNIHDKFFDELHVYAETKYYYSILNTMLTPCCLKPTIIWRGGKRTVCPKCKKETINIGWIKPQAKIKI